MTTKTTTIVNAATDQLTRDFLRDINQLIRAYVRTACRPTVTMFGSAFGTIKVTVLWNGKVYRTTVKAPGSSVGRFSFARLPEKFGFAPTDDFAMDITARSALRSFVSARTRD